MRRLFRTSPLFQPRYFLRPSSTVLSQFVSPPNFTARPPVGSGFMLSTTDAFSGFRTWIDTEKERVTDPFSKQFLDRLEGCIKEEFDLIEFVPDSWKATSIQWSQHVVISTDASWVSEFEVQVSAVCRSADRRVLFARTARIDIDSLFPTEFKLAYKDPPVAELIAFIYGTQCGIESGVYKFDVVTDNYLTYKYLALNTTNLFNQDSHKFLVISAKKIWLSSQSPNGVDWISGPSNIVADRASRVAFGENSQSDGKSKYSESKFVKAVVFDNFYYSVPPVKNIKAGPDFDDLVETILEQL